MMDCSRTEVFLAELKRMCASDVGCHKCKLYKLVDPQRLCVDGGGAFAKEPKKTIEIVQEWSDQHPVRTRFSVLLEQYPNCIKNDRGEPSICAGTLYDFVGCVYDVYGNRDCMKCWNTPIEDGESNA